MCRNVIFASLSPHGSRIPDYLMESLFDTVRFNDDGFAVFAVTDTGTVYERTLSLYRYAHALISLQQANVIFLHTHQRAATMGAISVDNVHLWKYGDILFSHNGVVYNYAEPYYVTLYTVTYKHRNYVSEVDSDSKKFFDNNAQKIAKYFSRGRLGNIEKICANEGLWGVVMINDTRGKFAVLGVGKPVYLYLADAYAVVSNTEVAAPKEVKSVRCKIVRGRAGSKRIQYVKYREEVTMKNYQPTDWYLEYF